MQHVKGFTLIQTLTLSQLMHLHEFFVSNQDMMCIADVSLDGHKEHRMCLYSRVRVMWQSFA